MWSPWTESPEPPLRSPARDDFLIVQHGSLEPDSRFDIVVIGGGVAGMAAALFAAIAGRRALLVERTAFLGGTSALSAGTIWVPNTAHAAEIGAEDSFDRALRFLDGVVGNHAPRALREAFLRSGPKAIAALEAQSEVRLRAYALHPDYEQEVEGATLRGRALEPLPFDGRQLGTELKRLRPPIPEFTILGGMMVDRTDIGHLLSAHKKLGSLAHALRLLGAYARDRLAGRRGTRLVMGNALAGRFLASLQVMRVPILLETDTVGFVTDSGGVDGVVLRGGGIERRVLADAVVLASGGFGRHGERRTAMLHEPVPEVSPMAPGAEGALQDLALGLGAGIGAGNLDNAFWAPVSRRRRADGSVAVFPHFVLDRSKPGTVCVDQAGRRFTNESASYHRFARAMFEANRTAPCIPCYLIADAPALRRYGLGMVRMRARDLRPFIRDGYLVEAASIAELAGKLGIRAEVLEQTIARMNGHAASGTDPDFGRGSTAYHRVNGDREHGPNPTLGPIATPPFYALRLYPAEIGNAAGLVTDEWARVLRADGAPVPRLYACGNDANSMMGGTYPGPGITLGPAIVFAWRAVMDALGRRSEA
jgi:succinate dehydrogenase/fumarate reductase flavoprotein subunit